MSCWIGMKHKSITSLQHSSSQPSRANFSPGTSNHLHLYTIYTVYACTTLSLFTPLPSILRGNTIVCVKCWLMAKGRAFYVFPFFTFCFFASITLSGRSSDLKEMSTPTQDSESARLRRFLLPLRLPPELSTPTCTCIHCTVWTTSYAQPCKK